MPAQMAGQRSLRIELEIRDGRGRRNKYQVVPLRPVEGAGWRLFKLGRVQPEVLQRYAIYYSEAAGLTCDCKGFEGHGYCKHTDALKALLGDLVQVPEVAK